MSKTQIKGVGGIDANLAPDAFHLWATHYYKCCRDFERPQTFSPVPYFLLCRAIELELKARHLKAKPQKEVKDTYGHDLYKVYKDLPSSDQILTSEQVDILKHASRIYKSKGFEYFEPEDALSGYRQYPDLSELDDVAKRLIGI